jgi:hypothetical protein
MSYLTRHLGSTQPPSGSQINWSLGLSAGLQFFYTFSEASGLALYDAAGRAEPAAFTDAPTWTSGTSGSALSFDGSSDYLENTSLVLPTDAVTIMQIIRSPDSSDIGSSFGNRDSHIGADTARCQTHVPFSGTIYWDFGQSSGANRTQYTPDSTFWDRWHVMFFVAGNVGSQIWEDGSLKISSSTAITRVNSATGFYIGRFGDDGQRQRMLMSSIALWNRCLLPDEILALTAQPYRVFGRPNFSRLMSIAGPISGTSAVTAPAATLTASGTIVNAYTGTSAVTAAAATMAATGTVVNPATNTGRLMLLGIG